MSYRNFIWDVQEIEGGIRVCRNLHEPHQPHEWEYYVPATSHRSSVNTICNTIALAVFLAADDATIKGLRDAAYMIYGEEAVNRALKRAQQEICPPQ